MIAKTDISARQLADTIVEALQDKKGGDILIMDLRKVRGAITDYFVVCTGTSDKHVQSLSDNVWEECRVKLGDKPKSTEGRQLGEWILIDYFNVLVHIFQEDQRKFYDIESLWGDGKMIKVKQTWW